jgi:hypothetical protein
MRSQKSRFAVTKHPAAANQVPDNESQAILATQKIPDLQVLRAKRFVGN